LKTVTLIGGADYQKQLSKVNQSPVDLIVATPGRLIDFMERRDLALDRVETLVLDERIVCWIWGLFLRLSALCAPHPARKIGKRCCFRPLSLRTS
jgi:ATP-dependent RNA helicase RhlB